MMGIIVFSLIAILGILFIIAVVFEFIYIPIKAQKVLNEFIAMGDEEYHKDVYCIRLQINDIEKCPTGFIYNKEKVRRSRGYLFLQEGFNERLDGYVISRYTERFTVKYKPKGKVYE